MRTIDFPAIASAARGLRVRVGERGVFGRALALARRRILRTLRTIARWRRMMATRAALESLDERTLRDIGLYRSEIHAAALGTLGGRHRYRARVRRREPA